MTPVPIFDPAQRLPYFKDLMVFFQPGDIVKWKPIDRAEYDRVLQEVEAGRYTPRSVPVSFALQDFLADPAAYNRQLLEALNEH